jgi:hypothetical protein
LSVVRWLLSVGCCLLLVTCWRSVVLISPPTQTHKDLPSQLLLAKTPLRASLIIGSFGASKPAVVPVFEVNVKRDLNVPVDYAPPLRYGKLAEIHHQFKPDPKSPPKVVSLVFAAAVLAALPALFVAVSPSLYPPFPFV